MNTKQVLGFTLATIIASQNCQAIFAGERGGVSKSLALTSATVFKNNSLCVSNENVNNDLSCYDEYVKVVDNKYVLELPDNVFLPDDVIAKIQEQINLSNKLIATENLRIDPYSKSAVIIGKCTNGEGINAVEFNWNYVRVYLSAKNWRILLQAGVGAAEATIMGILNVTSTVALGIAGAIWGALSGIIGEYVQDGVWFDLNYFYQYVNNFGWQ